MAKGSVPKPIRVLVVDDVEDTRTLYAEYLVVSHAMDVRTADDGEAAIQLAREWKPEVIVMDLAMPRVTGAEATVAIKRDPKTRDIAILLLTAFGSVGRATAQAIGADSFCEKPCNPVELAVMVKSLALARRTRRKKSVRPRPQ